MFHVLQTPRRLNGAELTRSSGMQPRAVQGMLDFDFICKRSTPSVAGIIYTFGGQFVSKM